MSTPPPTPETDSKSGYPDDSGCWKYNDLGLYVDADFARRLERERDEAREENEAMREAIRVAHDSLKAIDNLHNDDFPSEGNVALIKLQPFLP
jgi:hypothetical protein